MNADCIKFQTVRARGRVWPVSWVWTVCGVILFSLAAGCAPTKPSIPELVVEQSPVVEQPPIARLDDGRTGFVITEISDPGVAWRSEFDRAVVMLQEGQYPAAIAILEDIVEQSPGVTAPHINLAMAYRQAGKLEQAEDQLQQALQLFPSHPVANNEYGLVLRHSGRFEEARKVYEATLQAFPEYLPVRLNLGILCEIYLKDRVCAVEQYTAYSEASPDNETVALWIADLNLRMGHQ